MAGPRHPTGARSDAGLLVLDSEAPLAAHAVARLVARIQASTEDHFPALGRGYSFFGRASVCDMDE